MTGLTFFIAGVILLALNLPGISAIGGLCIVAALAIWFAGAIPKDRG